MKPKHIATFVLLAFVGVSLACLVIQESTTTPVQTDSEQTAQPGATPCHKLVAYYFHRTQRCPTCLKIEAYSEQALKDAYPKAFEAGELEWQAVNLEEPAYEHFVDDYELTASSLVLADFRDGKQQEWRNLALVWELVDDELKFKAYVAAEAAAFLEQEP